MKRIIINKTKKIALNARILRREFYGNISFKKSLKKEELDYLTSNEKKEAKNYWEKYTNKYNVDYCSYYSSKSGKFDKNYIPDNLHYNYITPYFNNMKKTQGIDDKNYYDKLFENMNQPKTLLRKINGYYYDNEYNFLNDIDIQKKSELGKENIFKPSTDTSGGAGIVFIDKLDTKKLNDLLLTSNDFIIQKQIKQHKALSDLHPSSVNTIRVISLFFEGNIYILSSVLRMGVSGNRVDNASSGGIVVGIDEKGFLKKEAIDLVESKSYIRHPDTNIIFEGYNIPNYRKVVEVIKQEAINFPSFKLISWDLSLDNNGDVVLIEFNLRRGQLDFHQITNGPLFKDLTDQVLEKVFNEES